MGDEKKSLVTYLLVGLKNYLNHRYANQKETISKNNIDDSTPIYINDKGSNIKDTTFIKQFGDNPKKLEKALKKAWHNRDFEIEMYWKRATYFWTFIGATFLGYFALIGSSGYHQELKESFYQIEALIITIGLIFSISWYYVNKGSKAWQVNWECQIDALETLLKRPNYTTIYYDHKNKYYSVSRINLSVSLIVTTIWTLLYLSYWIRWYECYYPFSDPPAIQSLLNWISLATILLIVLFFFYLIRWSKSDVSKQAKPIFEKREAKRSQFDKEENYKRFFFKRIKRTT